jgi:hypothetical protein
MKQKLSSCLNLSLEAVIHRFKTGNGQSFAWGSEKGYYQQPLGRQCI